MGKPLHVILVIFFAQALSRTVPAQDSSTTQPNPIRVVVAAPSAGSETVIAVPPATSWTGKIGSGAPKADAPNVGDLSSWVDQQSGLNGLENLSTPWRIVISYEQFDEDGDNVHSGTYEELWAGPKRYRASFRSDDLNQTDYATAQGLYRQGDQQWPNRAQSQIPKEVISPFFYARTLRGVHIRGVSEIFDTHVLSCSVIENGPGKISSPTEYCFNQRGSELRYSRGSGWYQTTYNDLTAFLGRSVGKTVNVYDGGKPYLQLHVQRLEEVPNATDADFTPPADAKRLSGQVLTGVAAVPLQQSFPEWPDSLRQQHFSVTVEIVIGKDGHVQSAHAISGPQNAFKPAEATVRKWTFQPYMVLDEPAEVSTKVTLSNN